jgi:phosphoribosylformylglycinamidine cyclo-ligase
MKVGGISPLEMARTFNVGLGMIAVVPAERAEEAKAILAGAGETVFTVGTVHAVADGDARVTVTGMDAAWTA